MQQKLIRAEYRALDRRHVARCPHCGRETRVGFESDKAIMRGSCEHFIEIERAGPAAWVRFGGAAA